jgi:hypothetical protein
VPAECRRRGGALCCLSTIHARDCRGGRRRRVVRGFVRKGRRAVGRDAQGSARSRRRAPPVARWSRATRQGAGSGIRISFTTCPRYVKVQQAVAQVNARRPVQGTKWQEAQRRFPTVAKYRQRVISAGAKIVHGPSLTTLQALRTREPAYPGLGLRARATMWLKVQRFLRGRRRRHAASSRYSQTSPAISAGGRILDFAKGRINFAELATDALDR